MQPADRPLITPEKPRKHVFVSLPTESAMQLEGSETEDYPQPYTLKDADALHYLRQVLRLKPGSKLLLRDRTTPLQLLATLVEYQPRQATLLLEARGLARGMQQGPKVLLGMALIKEQRWDWLLQKATELGVFAVVPLQTEHSVVAVHDPQRKQQRWQAVVEAAAAQSENSFCPRVDWPQTLSHWLKVASVSAGDRRFILQERASSHLSLRQALRANDAVETPLSPGQTPPETICLLVGPEGGWHRDELALAQAHGFESVSLGESILRSETAALAALAAIRYEWPSGGSPPL
ncbi:MAG: RsmE family RNA methyltransferase [Candidatus Melainabacteria bacterium]|nr:RsmE family RNA methyltransferase [Candidatus Melainabacteria bacterium]